MYQIDRGLIRGYFFRSILTCVLTNTVYSSVATIGDASEYPGSTALQAKYALLKDNLVCINLEWKLPHFHAWR